MNTVDILTITTAIEARAEETKSDLDTPVTFRDLIEIFKKVEKSVENRED